MNKRLFIGSLAFLLGCGCLAASTNYREGILNPASVLHIEDINQETLQTFLQGKLTDFVLECPEGTKLPLYFSLKGDIMASEEQETTPLFITFSRTFYIRCEKDQWLFSVDGNEWKGLLDFFTGTISFGLDACQGFPKASFGVEANVRN